jgi:hypothetical protein
LSFFVCPLKNNWENFFLRCVELPSEALFALAAASLIPALGVASETEYPFALAAASLVPALGGEAEVEDLFDRVPTSVFLVHIGPFALDKANRCGSAKESIYICSHQLLLIEKRRKAGTNMKGRKGIYS